MKNSQIVFLLFLAISAAFAEVTVQDLGFTAVTHLFGGEEFERETAEGIESIVHLPKKGFLSKKEHYDDLFNIFDFHRKNPGFMKSEKLAATLECSAGNRPDYLKFFPEYIGTLNADNPSITFSAPCFQENTISLDFNSGSVQVTLKNAKAKSLTCADTYFFSTLINYHFKPYFRRGTHKTTYKVSSEEFEQIKTTGIFIFRTCDRLRNILPDMFKTSLLFLGEIRLLLGIDPHDHNVPTEFDIKQSLKFIEKATGYKYKERKNVFVEIDESLVRSGDFFAVRKFDGTGNLVAYGTGSHVNHCTVAMRVNGELYIAESNSDFEWPIMGLQMTPYKTWIKWAINQGYLVTWLPLKKEFADKFDEKAALDWFKTVEGLPYGIHNYIWGWLDTPDHNYPPVLPPEFLATMFGLMEKAAPDAVNQMFTMGLNKRLGTTNLTTIAEVAAEAHKRGLKLTDLYGIVEQDGWEYPEGYSYVCSAFVAAILKAGGLFGENYVHAVEFTPRDIYELEFYDPNPEVPANCKAVDPENPFCQIMGGYRIEFPTVSSVKSYAHMNEQCWSEAPYYFRLPEDC